WCYQFGVPIIASSTTTQVRLHKYLIYAPQSLRTELNTPDLNVIFGHDAAVDPLVYFLL
ncbi:32683_t:CDS:1, partial [Racocetra persica]